MRTFLHEELLRGDDLIKVQAAKIGIFGCGALGSWIALFLANCGVHDFTLVDFDRVEEHNLSTQFHARWMLGKTKVQALSQELYRRHGCDCTRLPIRLDSSTIHKPFRFPLNLIICSFDNYKGRKIVQDFYFNHHLHDVGVLGLELPTMFVGMHGAEYYMSIDWAETFQNPQDLEEDPIDPCNYPLAVSLVTTLSGLATEVAIRYLVDKEKLRVKRSMLEVFK